MLWQYSATAIGSTGLLECYSGEIECKMVLSELLQFQLRPKSAWHSACTNIASETRLRTWSTWNPTPRAIGSQVPPPGCFCKTWSAVVWKLKELGARLKMTAEMLLSIRFFISSLSGPHLLCSRLGQRCFCKHLSSCIQNYLLLYNDQR